ncbi:hypothetical protein HJC23_000754 [Cyclotella cryptica]|uniref:HMG box domain-containing protein n=1 Tax=Cyclotella cryptica TaxID=29204 RepID=A0ABD3PYW0_9STRA
MSQNGPSLHRGEMIPPKPRRPLTCYGIFSVLERNYIWQQNHTVTTSSVSRDAGVDPYADSRPERYRDLVLPSNWFVVGKNRKKRTKHKDHSVIPFKDLTKTIAERWRSASPEIKMYCELIAIDELERYRRDIDEYKERYGNDAVKARKSKKRKPCKPPVKKDCASLEDSDSSGMGDCCHDENNNESCDSEGSGMSSKAMRAPRRYKLSDYFSDDRSEALELVGYNYDNILTGNELLTAFEVDDESDEESEQDHSSRNDSSSTVQGSSLFEVNCEMFGQQTLSASLQDQRNHSLVSPAVSPLNVIPSSTSPPAQDPIETVHMYGAFQQWYRGRHSF